MRILIVSPAFTPQVGGLELAVEQLATGLAACGHEVVVWTKTPDDSPERLPFRVLRQPGPLTVLRWVRWCEVFFQANLSLRCAWPLLVCRRPWVVAHHSWYRRPEGRIAWQDRLKRFLLRFATSVAVSQAVADDLPVPATVIPNAYRDDLFRVLPGVDRSGELIFVGRLVSDKGADLLLDALARLAVSGLCPRLTIVGDGPEAPRLRELAARLGLGERVSFLGTRGAEELVGLLNRHRILVVPSRYHEPFGIVALEGIACGCVVVGSAGGGLAQAIGPCGRTLPNGDVEALARVLEDLLARPEALAALLARADEHLAAHASRRVVASYLAVLQAAARSAERPAGAA